MLITGWGTYGFHEFLLAAAGNRDTTSTFTLAEDRILSGPERNFCCILVDHFNEDMAQCLALPVEQNVGTSDRLFQPVGNHGGSNILRFL